jgi:hypothetical protein
MTSKEIDAISQTASRHHAKSRPRSLESVSATPLPGAMRFWSSRRYTWVMSGQTGLVPSVAVLLIGLGLWVALDVLSVSGLTSPTDR